MNAKFLIAIALAGCALTAGAQNQSTNAPPRAVNGRTLFLKNCAHCHGATAHGDEGPDLHDLQVSDRRIATVVRRGIPHEMPSFVHKYQAPDIAAVIAYLRTLR